MSQYRELELDSRDDTPSMVTLDRDQVIPETAKFDQFVTIDWITEENTPLLSIPNERDVLNDGFKKYRQLLWERSRTVVTLTVIAVTIGCIAGFLQIFTETLVNWKTGHCARNWLLNKSFCCSVIETSPNNSKRLYDFKLTKRDELDCLDEGLWINWSGYITPFPIFLILSVSFSLISTLLVKYVAPMATGSGITEIKVWVTGFKYKDEFLNAITLFVKSIALPLAISSGLSIGKEGPSVHYAACVGYTVANWLLRDVLTFSQQSEYLIAASGAGVAVAFGAPIGGVLFGLEEIAASSEFNASTLWKSYYVALVAVATLKWINPFRNGMIVLFNVTYDKYWTKGEIPVFIFLGIFGGLYGKYISKWNIYYVHLRRKYLTKWPVQEVIILTIFTAFISYFNEFLKLDMTESMGILFHECAKGDDISAFGHRLCQLDKTSNVGSFIQIISSLLFATIVRSLLVVISYGASVPAGIFVPSMAVGATFGRAISLFVERFISGPGVITPGTYAFLGAAATLSGITNLTITVVVIMFELTGAFIYIIPTMMVVAITRLVLNHEGIKGGIADQMVFVNGFPYLEYEKEDLFMKEFSAGSIMTTNLKFLYETMNLAELKDFLYSGDGLKLKGFPVINESDRLEPTKRCVGYVLKKHILARLLSPEMDFSNPEMITVSLMSSSKASQIMLEGDDILDFSDIVNSSPIFIKKNVPATLLFRMFKQLGCKTILVEESGVLEGLITRKDLLRFQRIKHREVFGPINQSNKFFDDIVRPSIQTVIKTLST
ncbi:hypothetical protein Kpol_1067p32 [Vanderwaltozyma polyspora DSM 70294]|uniref:Chloride channel protein n=1 Tax=Vanderwaltozyma polyspora (strain ATCC 22028 / DSM 70294 / BCRC 21397 / CBS 2163 / NBRC 10782 / NRRL Y-8283 / UCD 57-17) TaxID=436907 RepID=A7TNX6_VANPO|nr:uncharacterized protein Kpol_1067p32 [Vanderwaltozyma polyspora DSM 70294]EDO16059.1 hypothetical protein Kpol_1067p32 [Vanderwaltozyma polyspora DSM 70294]